MSDVRLRVLGTLEAVVDGAVVRPTSAQQRRVLAALALTPGLVVSNDRLMAALWGDDLPPSARKSLRAHVSRLRDVLSDDAGAVVATRADGYLLQIAADDLDAVRFERLTAQARDASATDPARALALFDEALALWTGPAYADFAAESFARPDAVRLDELRRAVTEDRFEVLLRVGRHDELIPELQRFTRRHPLRERPQRQLMVALYRSGRQADALAACRSFRARLADELGLRPSTALQALERRILRQDPELDDGGAVAPAGPSGPPPGPTGRRTVTVVDELVERDAELAVLDALVAAVADHGDGRVAIVHGEAGIGKTAVIRQFAQRLHGRAGVAWGACDPLFTPRPLGPLRDIAAGIGGAVSEAVAAPARPYAVAAALLDAFGAGGPTVVVIEDLQWADEATLDVLRLLARRLRGMPVLVVLSYRDDELPAGHPLHRVLGDLARLPGTVHIPLAPLSRSAVVELAADAGRDGAAVYDATDGNPLFVTEVLASPTDEVPESVLHAVVGRADALDTSARAVLELVAVAPPRVEPWLLAALTGGTRRELDACVGAGLLASGPDGIAFRHDLARRAFESTIPPHRRRALHARVLDALSGAAATHDDLPRVVHHADGAADVATVVDSGRDAARQAWAVGAHREAAAYCARVLRHGERLEPAVRAAVLDQFVQASVLAGDNDSAIKAAERAVQLHRASGDRRAEANALRSLARVLWGPGRTIEATALVGQALRMLDGLPASRELGRTCADAGWLALSSGDAPRAVELSERARHIAAEVGHVGIDLEAATTLAAVAGVRGDCEAAAAFARCRDAAAAAGLDEQVSRVLLTEAVSCLRSYDHDRAEDAADEAEQVCRDYGHELTLCYVQAYQAAIALERGRWSRASELASTVLAHPPAATIPRVLALCVAGLLAARTGQSDAADELNEADQLAAPTGELERLLPPKLARAEVAWLRGESAEVLRATDSIDTAARERGAVWVVGPVATWRMRAGDDRGVPTDVAVPHRLQAAGDHQAAARWWMARGCAYLAALALLDAGDDTSVAEASDVLRQLGAVRTARVASRVLSRAGRRSGV